MERLKRGLALMVLTGSVVWVIGLDTIHVGASGALRRVWQEGAQRWIEQDLKRIAAGIETKVADLERVKQKQRELKSRLTQMQEARAARSRALDNDRDVLSQIARILRSQPSASIAIEGTVYDRATIEADARRYLGRCQAAEDEVRHLDTVIAEIAAGVARVEAMVEAAGTRLASQRAAYDRFRTQDDSRRLRGEIKQLTADGLSASEDGLIEEVATLLQPLAVPPRDDAEGPRFRGGDRQVALEVDSYLASLEEHGRTR
jgi:phage shock protein A